MKKTHFSERGQALIIFVFALIGLIGITGLAVDGGNVLAERRHAQNAADTAAMAGALAKINGQKANSTWTDALCSTTSSACWSVIVNTAKNRASSNGYTGDLVNNTVEVHIPPISGPYSDCSDYSFDCRDYVQVIINTNVNTFFARALGIAQTHNRVEAVALAQYAPETGLYEGFSLVELAPNGGTSCDGEFKTSGNVKLTLEGGGVWVNSDSEDCAFVEEAGCVDWTLIPPPPDPGSPLVSVFGGSKYSSCPEPPPIVAAPYQVKFPPDPLFPEPDECNKSYQAAENIGGTWNYYPGHYTDRVFPPDRNAYLTPGVYCVDNLVKTTNLYDLQGDNVMLYIREGGTFDFQGGFVRLTAPTSGTYKGYLMYVQSTFDPWGDENCTINGDVAQDLTGTIYAPNCNVTINGGTNTTQYAAQVIAYTLKLTGTAGLNFIYDPSKLPRVPEVRHTGLYR